MHQKSSYLNQLFEKCFNSFIKPKSKLQGKITDAEASNDSLQQLLEALKKENADLKAKLLEKDKIIEINEMNFAQISAQMGEFEALVNNQAQEIDTLKEENSRLSSKRSEDESTLDTATAQIKDLEASKQQVLNQLTKSDENAKVSLFNIHFFLFFFSFIINNTKLLTTRKYSTLFFLNHFNPFFRFYNFENL